MSRLSLVLGCAGLLLCTACTDPTPAPRSVLLVTFDTTRADRIGAYGYTAAATPTWDALAAAGLRFESAMAPTPITLPSHASLMTGHPPAVHGARDNGLYVLSSEAVLVSERLLDAGWRTGAFIGSFVLDARYGLDQGFEVYDGPPESSLRGERPAAEVVDAAIRWFDALPDVARFFCWVHFFDPHEPFFVPKDFRSQAQGSYDSQIAYADAEFGRLLAHLAETGRKRELSIVATSDHGESLGEHGEQSHGVFLYQSTLRVPLVMSGAGVAGRGAVATSRVGLVDVAPTLLALAGISPEAAGFGSSLLDASGAANTGPADRAYRIESWLPYHAFRWRALQGIVSGDHKLIEGQRVELYDLTRDPGEQHDLSDAQPDRVAQLREQLAAFEAGDRKPALSQQHQVAPHERALLESLGYAVGRAGDGPFADGLPDPADRIGDVALISEAEGFLGRAMRASQRRGVDRPDLFESARDAYERLRERNPADPHVSYGLGFSEYGLGNFAAAAGWLEQAVEMHPTRGDVHEMLARCYAALGRNPEAEHVRARAAELAPPRE